MEVSSTVQEVKGAMAVSNYGIAYRWQKALRLQKVVCLYFDVCYSKFLLGLEWKEGEDTISGNGYWSVFLYFVILRVGISRDK
jgi:hypothetical protein